MVFYYYYAGRFVNFFSVKFFGLRIFWRMTVFWNRQVEEKCHSEKIRRPNYFTEQKVYKSARIVIKTTRFFTTYIFCKRLKRETYKSWELYARYGCHVSLHRRRVSTSSTFLCEWYGKIYYRIRVFFSVGFVHVPIPVPVHHLRS